MQKQVFFNKDLLKWIYWIEGSLMLSFDVSTAKRKNSLGPKVLMTYLFWVKVIYPPVIHFLLHKYSILSKVCSLKCSDALSRITFSSPRIQFFKGGTFICHRLSVQDYLFLVDSLLLAWQDSYWKRDFIYSKINVISKISRGIKKIFFLYHDSIP